MLHTKHKRTDRSVRHLANFLSLWPEAGFITNLEVVGELLQLGVRVDGVLATEVRVSDVVKPRLQCRYSLECSPRVVDGSRQSGRVLTRRLDDARPTRPQSLDVCLQVLGEQRISVRPKHRRHRHDAVHCRLHRTNVVLHALNNNNIIIIIIIYSFNTLDIRNL